MKLRSSTAVLWVIVMAQFFGTSLWFAVNGVMSSVTADFHLPESALGHLTMGIQLGLICGTMVFALLRIPDRFSPSRVFLWSACAGAVTNAALLWNGNTYVVLILLRFLTGFCLAGIYPVGMKLAADYFNKGLGRAMGLLLGALVAGTALPHLLRYLGTELHWRLVIIWISCLAVAGGVMVGLLVGDGPYRKPGPALRMDALLHVFRPAGFRRAAFGYFGHMWEVYALWTFLPIYLLHFKQTYGSPYHVSLWSFLIIGIGAFGCLASGLLSKRWGPAKTGALALLISGGCCLTSYWFFHSGNLILFLGMALVWGFAVIADSPMFSTLVAQEAQADHRGTALTAVTCIGFAITIVSIQVLNWMTTHLQLEYLFLPLVAGPIFGLMSVLRLGKRTKALSQ